jgi:catechol 2,3-dioxygenase-like lactoylglutathione lyase family enzyme
MTWELGHVGHFGLAVTDPERSARWWIEKIGVERQFDFEDGVAVGTSAVTIVLTRGKPDPAAFGHLSFHLRSMAALRKARADLRERHVDLEDPGDEIGPEAPGSPHMGLWFHDLDGYRWELNVQNAVDQ